jgi:hypothetical protein
LAQARRELTAVAGEVIDDVVFRHGMY